VFRFLSGGKTTMIDRSDALPGRDTPMPVTDRHAVLGTPLTGPWPDGHEVIYLAMGCFWGAERIFWEIDGVHSTAVGYMGGWTPNPTYEETCTAKTGHTESVQVVFDPSAVDLDVLLKGFWENHDPTTPNRQGNDIGTQYRSAIYPTTDAQMAAVQDSRQRYQTALEEKGFGQISTEIAPASEAGDGVFYYAEDHHQAYLHKNPGGYCNHGFCQVGYDLEAHGQQAAQATLPER
jgi:peptide-methionine (S)-S-oxide reductase